MESGPFRAPQPVERRVASREESAPRAVEVPAPVAEAPKASVRTEPTRREPKEKVKKTFKRRLIFPIILIIVILGLAFGAWSFFSNKQGAVAPIDTSKYQAVFSTSGLVYFGKLQSVNSDYFKLTKAYYLQSPTTGTTSTSTDTSTDQKLIKLSDAIHGPEDEMIIPKSQVLFYENLQSSSKVAQAIQKTILKTYFNELT